jgi:hypothetical protein
VRQHREPVGRTDLGLRSQIEAGCVYRIAHNPFIIYP